MGEAKRRGSKEYRVSEAEKRTAAEMERLRKLMPESVICNKCQAVLTDIEPVDMRDVPGIELAGVACCEVCDSETVFVEGDALSVIQFKHLLSQAVGGGNMLEGQIRRSGRTA